MEQANHIGARLRAARERLGLSREALAFHSGVSWSAIAQVEAGRRTNLRPSTLSALAGVLRVSIDYLVLGRAATETMLEHRALLYATDAEFVAGVASFLVEGISRHEAALVVTSEGNIAALRQRLGASATEVEFAERAAWYSTPSAALEGYRRFMETAVHAGAPWVRILGEPVWVGRSDGEVRLWARYESLLNLVFSSAPATILCSYDLRELDANVIDHARATHPETVEREKLATSPRYAEPGTFTLQP